MALENYMKPEKLCGDNQYECSQCNKKVDAIKGLKLKKSPTVLTIQLSRFTLDFNTFQRVKITDRVSFPFLLNMNDYMQGYEGIQNKLYEKEVERMQQYRKKDIEEKMQKESEKRAKMMEKKEKEEKEEKEERERMDMQGEDKHDIEMQDLSNDKKGKEKGVKI